MTDNKSVMNVTILKEAGFEEAMLAIATNKKKYERDMYPVSKKLAVAGGGHDKFLQMIAVWLRYTTTRGIHQQIDTYRVGVTKSSESTHHMLIEDTLESCIDRQFITDELARAGFVLNTEKCLDGLVPINNTALLIAKLNTAEIYSEYMEKKDQINLTDTLKSSTIRSNTFNLVKEFADKYLVADHELSDGDMNVIVPIMLRAFKIDYDKYYAMFEGGSEAITKETVDIMVNLAMTLEEDRYGKLHRMKRILPEGFIQTRVMSCNYQVLKTMIKQRFLDPFDHWRLFVLQIIKQVQHPEYFQDIFDYYHTSKEELLQNMCNGKEYISGLDVKKYL